MNYNLSNLLFESDSNTVHNLFEEQDKEKKDNESTKETKNIEITEENIDFKVQTETNKFCKAIANIINSKFQGSAENQNSDQPLGNFKAQTINSLNNKPISILGEKYSLEPFNIVGDLKSGASSTDVKEFAELQVIPIIVKNEENNKYLGGAAGDKKWLDVYFIPVLGVKIEDKLSKDVYAGLFELQSEKPFTLTQFSMSPVINVPVDKIDEFQKQLKNPTQNFVAFIKNSKTLKGTVSESYLNSLYLLLEEDEGEKITSQYATAEIVSGGESEEGESSEDSETMFSKEDLEKEFNSDELEKLGEANKEAEETSDSLFDSISSSLESFNKFFDGRTREGKSVSKNEKEEYLNNFGKLVDKTGQFLNLFTRVGRVSAALNGHKNMSKHHQRHLRKKVADLDKKLDNTFKALRGALEVSNTQRNNRFTEVEDKIRNIKKELGDFVKNVNRNKEDISKLRAFVKDEFADSSQELKKLDGNFKQFKTEVVDRLDKIESDVETVKGDVTDLKQNLQIIEQNLQETRSQIYDGDITDDLENIEGLENKIPTLKVVDEMFEVYDTLNEKEKEERREQIKQLFEQFSEYETNFVAYETYIDENLKKIESDQEIDSGKIKENRKKINSLRKSCELSRKWVEVRLNSRIDDVKEESKQEISTLKTSLDNVNAELEKSINNIQKNKTDISNLQSHVKEANTKIKDINKRFGQLNQKVKTLSKSLSKTQSKVSDIEKHLREKTNPKLKLHKELIDSTKETVETIINRVSGLEAQGIKDRQATKDVQKQVDQIKADFRIVKELQQKSEDLEELYLDHNIILNNLEAKSGANTDVITRLSREFANQRLALTDVAKKGEQALEELKTKISAKDLEKELTKLSQGFTTFMIAHDVETFKKVDEKINKAIDTYTDLLKDGLEEKEEEINRKFKSITEDIKQIKQRLSAVEGRVGDVEVNVQSIKDTLEVNKTNRLKYKNEIKNKLAELKDNKLSKEDFNKQKNNLVNYIKHVEKSLSQEIELIQIIQNSNTPEIEALKTNLQELTEDVDKLASYSLKQFKELNQVFDSIEKKFININDVIEKNNKLIEINKTAINQNKKAISDVIDNINNSFEKIDEFSRQTDERLTKGEKERKQLIDDFAALKQELESLKQAGVNPKEVEKIEKNIEQVGETIGDDEGIEFLEDDEVQLITDDLDNLSQEIKKLGDANYDTLFATDNVKSRVENTLEKYGAEANVQDEIKGLFENYIHDKNSIAELLFEEKSLLNEGISAKKIKNSRGKIDKTELQKAYDQLISNRNIRILADNIFEKLKEEFDESPDSGLTFEKLFSQLYESRNVKFKKLLKEGLFGSLKNLFSGNEKESKKAILSYVACHILGNAINEPRQKVMKILGLDISKGYDKEKSFNQDDINEFIGRLSKEQDCIAAATNESELTNLASSFNTFYKQESNDDIKEKCDELYGILKDNIALLQSGRLKDEDIAKFFKEKRVVKMIQDLLEGREVDQLKAKQPLEKFDREQEELIESVCIYYTMQYRKEEVENLDKRKMHSSEGKKAQPWLAGGIGAAGLAVIGGSILTGGLAAIAIGGLALGGAVSAASDEIDKWKADEGNITNAARALCKDDIKNLKSAILKINKEVLSETFIFKKGISLLIEQDNKTGNKYSIERDTLEKILKARGILGYKTDDSEKQSVTIGRIASLLDSEFGISVNDVDTDISFTPQSAAVDATTNKEAPVGTGANNNLEQMLKGMVPGMSGDLINNPLTMMMMMNRGGGDMASMLLMLMLMKNGTFENLLGNISNKGVTIKEAASEIDKAAQEEGIKGARKNMITALEDAAKSIDKDKPFLKKKEVIAIIKQVRLHIDFLKNNFKVDAQKINNDLDVVSHYIKPYVNIVSNKKELNDRGFKDIIPLVRGLTKSHHIALKIIEAILKDTKANAFKKSDFQGIEKEIEKYSEDKLKNEYKSSSGKKSEDDLNKFIEEFEKAFDIKEEKKEDKDTSTDEETKTSEEKVSGKEESFVKGKLSDLLFEEVDIIKNVNKRSRYTAHLEKELYRVWNIRK